MGGSTPKRKRPSALSIAAAFFVGAGAGLGVLGVMQSDAMPPLASSVDVVTRIDLNSADAALLATLPRIGPGLAQRIVDDREAHGRFLSVDDLTRVKGIGEKTVQRLRELVVAR